MIFFPAIDLKGGQCVRLQKGDMATAVVFNADPGAQAEAFAAAGAEWLHMVDLDGAFAGRAMNAAAVEAILARMTIPVQLGGGIRSAERIDFWLGQGVARVILGTVALRDPALVLQACRAHPGRIAVGLDARDGRVAISGWAEQTDVTVIDAARRFEDAGVAALIYTDIGRDGILAGPDVTGTVALARSVRIPVIASGGVGSLADLQGLQAAGGDLIAGVIAGRAIYDGRIDVAGAIDVLRRPNVGTAATTAGHPPC
ncbi:MAG: 1-(5-phosphoribosyl)-5-[(5-phosphoribosylamino)methylideneamino]imidazole-4-carboxamide isomerase [Rhodospirillales bacterium]